MAVLGGISALLFYVLLGVKLWALIDAVMRPAPTFEAAGKLTKPAWLVILVLTVLTHVLGRSALGLLSIAGTVAAFVYLLDVRPALAQFRRRR